LRTTREIGPLLAQLGGALFDIAPTLNDVGTTILNVLIPALDDGLGALNKLLQGDIEGGLIDPIAGLINDTVTYLNSGEGQQLLDDVSSSIFNTLANTLSGVSQDDTDTVASALGGAIGDVLTTLTTNFEESGLGSELTSLAARAMSGVAEAVAKYVSSEEFTSDVKVIGGAVGKSLFNAVKAGIVSEATDFSLTGFAAAAITKKGGEANNYVQDQAAENRQTINQGTDFDLQGPGDTQPAQTTTTSGNGGDDKSIGEEIREALDTMGLALRGELDVSDNVASLEDVDARLEQEVRNSRESGTGGTF